MKSNYKTDPAITYDHMDTDMQNSDNAHIKISTQKVIVAAELLVIIILFSVMILLLS